MSDMQDTRETRREFLTRSGRYSLATPPIVALMLAAAEHNYARTRSDSFRFDRDHDRDHGIFAKLPQRK